MKECVNSLNISTEDSILSTSEDILQSAINAGGLPSNSSELQGEGIIIGESQTSRQCVPSLTVEEKLTDEVGDEQWKVIYITPGNLVDIPAGVHRAAEVISEIQAPHQPGPSLTPAEEKQNSEKYLKMKETSRKSNIAYKERVGMKCYKATKQMLLSENEDLRERVKHLEDKLKEEKIKSKIAEVDKVTASEPPPAAGLAPQENPDSGVETEDELVVKPKKRKNQMRLTIGGKHGMDGEIPVIVSDPPKSLSLEKLECFYFRVLMFFWRETERTKAWMARQDAQLINQGLGDSLYSMEIQIKKHETFEKEQEEKVHALDELAAALIEVGHTASKEIVERDRAKLEKRSSQLLEGSRGRRLKLEAIGKSQRLAATRLDAKLS